MLENLKYVIFYGSLHNFIKIQSSSYFGLNAKPEIQILNVIYLYQKSLGQIFDRQT